MRVSDRVLIAKVLEAVGDAECAQLLHAMHSVPKTAQVLSNETNVPLSSIYRKLALLKSAGLVMVSSFRLTEEGKREDLLVSAVTEVRIDVSGSEIMVDLIPTQQNASRIWFEFFKS